MHIRSEFADFVAQRTGLSAAQVADGVFTFPMTEGSQAEQQLEDLFETSATFTGMAMSSAAKAGPNSFQVLYPMTHPHKLDHPASPDDAVDVFTSLEMQASDALGYSAIEKGVQKGGDGIFAVDLHRRPVLTDEFKPDGYVMSTPKGVLFVDTTPGEAGGVAFLQRLAPAYPRLTPEQKAAAAIESVPDMAQVRPEVQAALAPIAQATSVDVHGTLDSRTGNNGVVFRNGGQQVASLRIELPESRSMVPGITRVADGGSVAVHPVATDEYSERIELNGEERKYFLRGLRELEGRLWTGSDLQSRWERGEMISDHDEMRAVDTARSLRFAIDRVSLLLANGDLGAYDRLVTTTDDQASWLSRMRSGDGPDRAFRGA